MVLGLFQAVLGTLKMFLYIIPNYLSLFPPMGQISNYLSILIFQNHGLKTTLT